MPPPTSVVFDLGKVLFDFYNSNARRRVAAQTQLSDSEVQKFLDQSPLLYRFETGLMTQQQFFEEVQRQTSFRGSFEEFGGFFADIFSEIPPMIELHAALRRKGIPTYIFSNTNALAMVHVRHNFPFFANFDGYILSYEVKAMKPDAKIYAALEEMTGRHGAEILYLDDRPENVEAGAARGWQVILHTDPTQTRTAIERLGLLAGAGAPNANLLQ